MSDDVQQMHIKHETPNATIHRWAHLKSRGVAGLLDTESALLKSSNRAI
jgi:hypothetical protein